MIAQIYNKEAPFAHTYSIVAYDSITGEMGVAVQSHWFSVGTIVSWAEAGVGAIATQSFVNPDFGPDGLALLKQGFAPQEVLDTLIAADEGRGVRQLAIVDKNGKVAVYTGANCIPAAGHIKGDGYTVQANMMLNNTVWSAMSKAFENSTGSLEERLLTALEAAEAAGGDIRGKQSASLLVVRPEATGKLWIDRKTDLRVDDHVEPLVELRRLYNVKMAYDYMNDGDVAMEKDEMGKALELYHKAFELQPDNVEMKFWTAVTYANAGEIDKSLPLFKEVFLKNKNWKELLTRINGTDLLPISKENFQKIIK
ncbi:MAG: DUF1028 domain-containing protein [Chitinophagales bacterium]